MPKRRLLSAHDVLLGAKCFKVRTGRGHDEYHPRWYALLSEECRPEIAAFLNRLDEIGCWPEQLRQTLIKLIPKPKGGKRPIGLLTALVRLWERMRIREVRAWKAAAFRDYNWAPRRRSAQDAVWRQSVHCEAAAWRKHDAIADLYDLEKAYERVPLENV